MDIFKVIIGKNYNENISSERVISFVFEGEIKRLYRHQKLRELSTTKPVFNTKVNHIRTQMHYKTNPHKKLTNDYD